MNELVSIKSDEVVCTSLDVAESFGKRHTHVLDKIQQILNDSAEKSAQCFKESSYVDASGKKNPMYYMNRDGFSFLVMGFTGKKATDWKWRYIDAFNKMEKLLTEKNTEIWISTRKQGKLTRKAETDVIQKLVEYAKEQGSEHSDLLYMVYSRLANKMAGVENRDTATIKQLMHLELMEDTILHQIRKDIETDTHYKQIYQNCKGRLEQLRDIAYLS